MGTVTVPLTRGKVAIIDAEDAERVQAHRWFAQHIRHLWYGCRTVRDKGKRQTLYLHRFVLDAPPEMHVDHKDGDGLNCTRENLRLATKAQNKFNCGPRRDNTTGFKGVFRHGKRWKAAIGAGGTQRHLGCFATPEQAARAYDVAALALHGTFASLNFPGD